MSGGDGMEMFGDMLERLQRLSERLTAKEAELTEVNARNRFCSQDLASARAEAATAREELLQEATRVALLESRLAQTTAELRGSQEALHRASQQISGLDTTLGLSQAELTTTKSALSEKTRELDDLSEYYSSMLEAKEASLQSLQQLMDNQQRAHGEMQFLWEDQMEALKASITNGVTMLRGDAAHAHERDAMRVRMVKLEAEAADAAAQVHAAGSQLRERDKLLVRAERRIQALMQQVEQQRGSAAAATPSERPAIVPFSRDDPGSDSWPEALQEALRLVGGSGGSARLQKSLELVQATLVEERAQHKQMRERLGTKLARKSAEAAGLAGELELCRADVARLREGVGAARAGDARRAEDMRAEVEAHRAQLESMASEMEGMRARHEGAVAAVAGAARDQLREAAARQLRHVADLEMQLAAAVAEAAAPKRPHEAMVPMAEHKRLVGLRLERAREEGAAAEKALKRHLRAQHDEAIASLRSDTQRAIANASAAARSVAAGEHESELRSLAARLERAHADATQSGEAAQRSQHSLYVVRAHWGGLRTALAHLHASLTSNGGSGGGGKRLASSQLLAHLMAEWDPTSKGALESAVECSMASGKALLEAATEAWVGAQRDTGSLRAQVDDARSGRDALSAAGARAQTELRTHLAAAADATEAAAERAAEAQAEAAGSRVREEAARAEARRHADARSVAEGQVGALKARLAEASAEVDVLRARLDEAAGSTVSAGAALAAREQAMRKGDYELQDLLATVALLHQRIEFMSADAASSVDALKSKLSSILAPVRVPDLLGDAAMAAAAGGGGPAAMAVTAAAAAAAAHAASGPSARAAHAHLELRSLLQHELMSAEGRGSGTLAMQPGGAPAPPPEDALVGALSRAQGEVQAMVARLGQLEVAHWELSRGLSGAAAARGHLFSLSRELASGRPGIAAVLAKEMAALMDAGRDRDGGSSGSGAAPQQLQQAAAGGAPAAFNPSKVGDDLASAREILLDAAAAAKTCEAMLGGLAAAVPAWLTLTRAGMKARSRAELSKVRGATASQLGLVRQELQALRSEAVSQLRGAAGQLIALGAVLTPMGGELDTGAMARALAAVDDADDDGDGGGLAAAYNRSAAAAATRTGADVERAAAVEGLGAILATLRGDRQQLVGSVGSAVASIGGAGGGGWVGFSSPSRGGASGTPRGGGGMSSSPKKASLLGPVHELSAAVHGVRSDLAALQERHARLAAEHEAVTAECAGLRSAMLALSRLLQLPHDLALTLLGGAGGAGGWDGAISQLRDHVTSLLQHVHTAATEAAVRTVHVSGVEPLQARCAHLEAQLASVVSTLDDLRMGAAEGVAMHAAALQAMRTQLEAGAEEALSVALAMLRPEVAGMGDGAKALQRAMEGAWAASARAWSEHASAGAREAAAAVGALEGAAEELQASLQEQSKELEGAREELEGARAHAVAAAAADDAKAARARAESDALRGRVVEVEAARDVAEATAAAAVRSASRRSTLDLLPQLQLHTGEDGGSTGVGYT